MDDRLLGSQLKLGKMRFCGSSKGWLIAVEKDFTVSLINPFFRYKGTRMKENSIIRLPPINPPNFNKPKWAKISDHFVFKASISTDPILNSADCIVAVTYEGFRRLAFIRLGKERTWIYADGRHTLIEEVVFVEDKCYAVDNWSRLLSFDVTTRSNPNVKVVAKGIKRTGNTTRYLVALNEGKFLMVHRTYYFDYERNKRATGKIKVFELDLKECKWIEKDTLGGISLFAGDNFTIYVLASELSGW